MKQKLQGFVAGIAVGVLCASGAVLAKTAVENIEVSYDNIKVYKDNVLYDLKDANGSTIEPFIYNGTTYVPVRGAAQICDMQVDWNGETKSIYLWDEMPRPNGTNLMDVAPPYETENYKEYKSSERKSFLMGGKKYTDGFTLGENYGSNEYALINLDSKYSELNFTMGHLDGTDMDERTVWFYVDGQLIKEMAIDAQGLPQTISLPVKYGLQLKIVTSGSGATGFGNITVK